MDLTSAKAVISGGASGLGFATARAVIEAGGHAALLDINEDQGRESAASLGENAMFIRADVSSEEDVRRACSQAAEFMGGVTLAVSCAGILMPARVLGRDGPMPAEKFSQVITVNLIGTFILTKESANVMQHNEPNDDGERGVVVNTASVAAFEGQIGQASYSASKGGIVGMSMPVARELARFGIRVNTIAPGIFLTPMMAGLPEDVQKSLGAQVPFPSRLGRPDEYADMVAAIYGNAMINGECIRLDGAIRMHPK
ncbi:MAG: SDR family NAD(P)-dependent oxidoreductase [Gammaproteobacteria bacterium]|nr:SDR family NAD(P)-dependent oxidoreductase [Gammaproteobacteria bacterium]